MTKTASICLVLLLLLNVIGYYGIFVGLRHQNSRQFVERLDAGNFDTSETITLKIPLSIPYYGDTDFERVDGEFEYKGEFYRMVKQKLAKDTLHIVCIRDVKGKRIQKALRDYVKTFADQSADHSRSKTLLSFIKDYYQSRFSLAPACAGWNMSLSFPACDKVTTMPGVSNPSPPPEV